MARQLARGMGSFFKDCGCARPTRCPHPYTIRFRNGLGKQLEESGFDTQDDAIERLTQIYAEKKSTAPSVAEARRELGQKTVAEYAKHCVCHGHRCIRVLRFRVPGAPTRRRHDLYDRCGARRPELLAVDQSMPLAPAKPSTLLGTSVPWRRRPRSQFRPRRRG
ncbi:hypothetical protein GCM10010340_37690 [Streptomyces griseoloalbus]|nr:hypothetical protein GCM10010340_37690 [Streptomyces albaduncus]